jgi:hypothetical protein
MILSEMYIIEAMNRIVSEAVKSKASILKGILSNMMWCVSNLSRSKSRDGNDNYQMCIT